MECQYCLVRYMSFIRISVQLWPVIYERYRNDLVYFIRDAIAGVYDHSSFSGENDRCFSWRVHRCKTVEAYLCRLLRMTYFN